MFQKKNNNYRKSYLPNCSHKHFGSYIYRGIYLVQGKLPEGKLPEGKLPEGKIAPTENCPALFISLVKS